jgi:hypothetical protein
MNAPTILVVARAREKEAAAPSSEAHLRPEWGGDNLLPEWGAMLAFGPGITIETMVLRAPALKGN